MKVNPIEVINNISDFMKYFAPGYIFLTFYNLGSLSQREDKAEYLFIKCITASFCLVEFSAFLCDKIKWLQAIGTFILVLIAAIAGFLMGKILSCQKVASKLKDFFKCDTSNNILIDIWRTKGKKETTCIRFQLKDDSLIYEGQVEKIVSYFHNPTVVICYYMICDEEGDIIEDFSDIEEAKMIVEYSQIRRLEMV